MSCLLCAVSAALGARSGTPTLPDVPWDKSKEQRYLYGRSGKPKQQDNSQGPATTATEYK